MTGSLRSRLILGILLGMAVLLAAASATIYIVQGTQLHRAFDDTLLTSANSLALLIHPGPFGNWYDAAGLQRLPAGQVRQGALFQFWSDQPIDIPFPRGYPDGESNEEDLTGTLDHDESPPEPPFVGPEQGRLLDQPPPPSSRLLGGGMETRLRSVQRELVIRSPLLNGADLPRFETWLGEPRFENITMPDGTRGRAVGLQIQLPPPPPGSRPRPPAKLTTIVAASTAETERQLSFLAGLLAVTALGTMAISSGVAWLVVSRGLCPLATVARNIAAMDETGLKQRIADNGVPLEIAPVIDQLNELLGRLDAAFERERALTADVAHELRTPVAEIRAITEITLSRQREPGEYREALSETRDAIATMQGLIEKLLVLARLEAGQTKPELEAIALQPLAAKHWAQIRGPADARGIGFDNLCSSDAMVNADPGLLEVVLANVLFNAATYTPDGGRISAESRRSEGHWQLMVANTGCKLASEEVGRVFDRFWRADTARSKAGLNCGLGLALVRRAMEAMGGTATAQVSPDNRFILMLEFVAADTAAGEEYVPGDQRSGGDGRDRRLRAS